MRFPAYPAYKPSGIEWLGDVPEHWTVDCVKWSIVGWFNGIWGDEPNGVDDITCVRVADFDRQRFLVSEKPPTVRAIDRDQRRDRLLRSGDLLIEKSGGGENQLVGCVVYFAHDYDAVCSNFVARMPVAPGMNSRFWSYVHGALYSGRLNFPSIKQTTGIQNLDAAGYLNEKVPFPAPTEQRRIAEFLDVETDKVDSLVDKKRALIEKLKEKRAALVSRTVTRGLPPDAARAAGLDPHPKLRPSGIDWLRDIPEHWGTRPLRYCARFLGGATPDRSNPDYWDGEIPWVSPKDMKRSRIEDAEDHISVEGLKNSPLCLIPPRAVLVVVRGMILAHSFPVALTGAPVTINQDMKALVTGGGLTPEFLFWVLCGAARTLVSLTEESAHGTRKLDSGILARFSLPLPRLAEQEAIASYLDRETARIDGLIAKVEEAIERLLEYRSALVTAAVTGKIDVREVPSVPDPG